MRAHVVSAIDWSHDWREVMTLPPRWLDARVLESHGHVLHVDPGDTTGLGRPGGYEPFETEVLSWLVMPGATVVDAGANVGHYTLAFARAVGPEGRVIAFEPAPQTLRLLAHNVRVNGYRNIRIVPCALTAARASRRLFLSPDNQGDHRLHDDGKQRASVQVEAVALDDYLGRSTDPIALIKLDIQGTEPAALDGMQATLARHPEAWIATEFWPAGLASAGQSADAFLQRLHSLSSAILHIDERRRRLAPLDVAWLADTVTVERGNHTNLLLVPRAWRDTQAWPLRSVAPASDIDAPASTGR
jgi:FkbM family methyltransferase